jgi:hypothetical protein
MNLARLLEHKRALLDVRRQSSSDRLIAIDNELQEIDEYLTRLEAAAMPAATGILRNPRMHR